MFSEVPRAAGRAGKGSAGQAFGQQIQNGGIKPGWQKVRKKERNACQLDQGLKIYNPRWTRARNQEGLGGFFVLYYYDSSTTSLVSEN